ncbi:MAG: hypothetical protein WCP79_02355 [Bacillota bacterium]
MKKISFLLTLTLAFAIFATGCGRVDYSYVYRTFDKQTDYSGGNYTNYLVCYEPAQANFRELLESNIVSQLRDRGINATAGNEFFKNKDGRINKAQAQALVAAGKFDAVLIIGEIDDYKGNQMYEQLVGIANQTNDFPRKEYQAAYAKVYSVEQNAAVWKTDVILTKQVDSKNIAHEMANATANEVVNWLNNDDLIGNKYNMLPKQAINMLSRQDLKLSDSTEITRGLPNNYSLTAGALDGKYLVSGFYPTGDSKYITLKYSTKMSAGRLNIVITDSMNNVIYVLGNNLEANVSINTQEHSGFKIYICGQKATDVEIKLSIVQ